MANVTFTYRNSVDEVFKFVSDPEQVKRRCTAMGESNIQVEVSEHGGTRTVTCTREVEMDLPAFAKKLFKPRNTVIERKEWRDDGERKTCHFHVDVQGAPTQIDGDITITASGSEARYAIEFSVTAKIPLIRKKLEEYIEGITKEGMEREFAYNQEQLQAG